MKYVLALPIAALILVGCEEPQPRTVAEFLENEAALYGTLARCESQPAAGADAECRNARQAAERIAFIEERAMRKGREQAFEAARAEYRERLDRERDLRIRAEAAAEQARLESLTRSIPAATDSGASAEADGTAGPAASAPPADNPPAEVSDPVEPAATPPAERQD